MQNYAFGHRSTRKGLDNNGINGIENARFLGAKIWRIMSSSLKEPQTLNSFKTGIKTHQFDCNCRLCKRFVENLGFL